MAKEPSKNGAPKESDRTVNRHLKVLAVIALAWVGLFVLMLIEKEAEVRVMLPVVSVVFVGYLIYATVSVLSKRL